MKLLNNSNKSKNFIFQYDPFASPKRMFDRSEESVKTGKKHIQPKNILVSNKLETIYRAASSARLDLLSCLVKNRPENIQELAQLLQRDYANVWRDCQALNSLKIIKLKKKGKETKPFAIYEKITIEFPIMSVHKQGDNIALSV